MVPVEAGQGRHTLGRFMARRGHNSSFFSQDSTVWLILREQVCASSGQKHKLQIVGTCILEETSLKQRAIGGLT